MPFIRFTADPKLPRDIAHLGYKRDMVVEMDADHCERWVRRGVAVLLPTIVPTYPGAAPGTVPFVDLPNPEGAASVRAFYEDAPVVRVRSFEPTAAAPAYDSGEVTAEPVPEPAPEPTPVDRFGRRKRRG